MGPEFSWDENSAAEYRKNVFSASSALGATLIAKVNGNLIKERCSSPEAALELASQLKAGGDLTRHAAIEEQVLKSPHTALWYAFDIVDGPWPAGEHMISTSPMHAARYAQLVLRDRFHEAEQSIMQDADAASHYAKSVVKGRWEDAEAVISRSPKAASTYALDVLKAPWPEAEECIRSDDEAWDTYSFMFHGTEMKYI